MIGDFPKFAKKNTRNKQVLEQAFTFCLADLAYLADR